MKKYLTPHFISFLLMSLIPVSVTKAQEVGIGTLAPDHKLHISSNTSPLLKLDNTTALSSGIMSEMYFKTGTYYTGAIKTIGNGTITARLGFFTYAASNPTSLVERISIMDDGKVGIGINSPAYLLDVNGRVRVRHTSSPVATAGIAFMESTNTSDRGFVGMKDDDEIGFFGYNGGGWGLSMNTVSGNVSLLGNQLYVSGSDPFYTASFTNSSGDDYPAVEAIAEITGGYGIGLEAQGGEYGVYAIADEFGDANHRYGVYASGRHGNASNYGVYANAFSGTTAYGIYASASGGTTNWGGYFSGNVYTTGTYQPSDRKLKTDIRPLVNAVQLIKALKPSTYAYKTNEYKQMELPEGQQYGLVVDEVKQVFPSMVKLAVQPAVHENDDERKGRMISEEVTFEAVNYTAMIPVLIAAMQEQQAMIEAQQKKIEELEARLK